MSLAQMPLLEKYYPGSHLLESGNEDRSLYLSLWLLPPAKMERRYSKEIAELSLKHNELGSSAPFVPHVTVVGSIRCETHREAEELGKRLRRKLRRMNPVPCRFYGPDNVISGCNEKRCCAMYNEQNQLVWSQSCIAFMEQSDEYMALLEKAREVLELPQGGTCIYILRPLSNNAQRLSPSHLHLFHIAIGEPFIVDFETYTTTV